MKWIYIKQLNKYLVIWLYSRNLPTRTRRRTSQLLIHRLQLRVRLQRAAKVRLQPQLQSLPVVRRAKSSRRLTRRRAKRKPPAEKTRRAIKVTRLIRRRGTRRIRRRVHAAASRRRLVKIDMFQSIKPSILHSTPGVCLSPSQCYRFFRGLTIQMHYSLALHSKISLLSLETLSSASLSLFLYNSIVCANYVMQASTFFLCNRSRTVIAPTTTVHTRTFLFSANITIIP